MANLILWRHAEAQELNDGELDIDRVLTKRGRKDAANMANWLFQHLPANTEMICSPAKRCQQTAKALQKLNKKPLRIADFLSIDTNVAALAQEVLNEHNDKTLLLIGHQPNLGQLIAHLQGMNEATCIVKKGAVWWLRQKIVDGAQQTYLFTVQHPDYL
jgi:phosphohistidine phosphatase